MADYHQLDVTADHCPITFVKTKLRLEELAPGEQLAVLLREGEPLQNVPRSVKSEGHKILALEQVGEGIYRLIIERGED